MATLTSSYFLPSACLLFLLILSCSSEGRASETRNTTETHHHTVQVTSLLSGSACSSSTKGPNTKSTLEVVHRHGPCNQRGKGKVNAPTITEILSHDQSRVNSIQSRLDFSSGKQSLRSSKTTLPAKSGSSLGAGNYIVTVGLGTPKKDLSLIFDTGSDFTWTQCQPCVKYCYKQQETLLDPSTSKTYSNISCNSALCSQLSSATGNSPGCSTSTCLYAIQYGDQSFSIGFFGKEKLTLTNSDVFDNFFFGCGQNNRGLFGRTAGLLGLGRDKLSIVSQTAQKYGQYFSYCLPSTSSRTGYLTFGKSGVPSGVAFTPLSNSQGQSFYFIDITAIIVGGTKLSISPTVFSNSGTIIDSGTVITRLPPAAYSALRAAFRQQMTQYPTAPALSLLDTCYDLSKYTTVSIPKISFLFNGNVRVGLAFSGILYAGSASQVCLAFAGNSDASAVGIFGNVQQKTLNVVYDVAGGKLGFGPGSCS